MKYNLLRPRNVTKSQFIYCTEIAAETVVMTDELFVFINDNEQYRDISYVSGAERSYNMTSI